MTGDAVGTSTDSGTMPDLPGECDCEADELCVHGYNARCEGGPPQCVPRPAVPPSPCDPWTMDCCEDVCGAVDCDGRFCTDLPEPLHCSWPLKPCDVWQQDCADGEKCVPYANDSLSFSAKCMLLPDDPVPVGEPCMTKTDDYTGEDNCEKGALCEGVYEGNPNGVCQKLCTGSPQQPECPPGSFCTQITGSLVLCRPTCDPLAPECPPNEICIPHNEAFWCVGSSLDSGYLGPCGGATDCALGLTCVDSDTVPGCAPNFTGCCAPYCDVDAPACPDGLPCTKWFANGQGLPEFADVGVCHHP